MVILIHGHRAFERTRLRLLPNDWRCEGIRLTGLGDGHSLLYAKPARDEEPVHWETRSEKFQRGVRRR